MEIKHRQIVDIESVPNEVVMILYSIIRNSTRESLNEYLESRGGAAELISDVAWSELKNLADKIGPVKR